MYDIVNDPTFVLAIQLAITALVMFVALAIIARLSPGTIKSIKDAWVVARKYEPKIIAAVDEPTDEVVRLIARYTTIEPEKLAVYLPNILRAIGDALENVLGEDEATEQ